MLKLILSAILLVTAATAAPSVLPWAKLDMAKTENVLRFEPLVGIDLVWQTFKSEHDKDYAHAIEEGVRKAIFAENLKKIEMHNYLYSKGLKSYMMGVNHFSDMTEDEFMEMLNKQELPTLTSSASTYMSPNVNFTLPTQVDWREKGYVTPVKNQGQCGSCWIFSSTGAIEGQHFRKTGKLVSLSEQNILDCETKSKGCEGGFMHLAFNYIKENGGVDTEESYPYEGKKGTCRYDPKNKGAEVTGFVVIPGEKDKPADMERKLTEAVATVGPISVAMKATSKFMHYKSGVFDEAECDDEINHAMLVVGYGTLNGQDYYIVKNSWSPSWGEKGYVLMSRNKNNQCGIGVASMYPLV